MERDRFIEEAWEAATEIKKLGASISVPIAVAQAALESNFGNSKLSKDHNNLFGIKGDYHGAFVLLPTKEQDKNGNWVDTKAKFRSYPNWESSFDDYADIIERLPWYQDAQDASHEPMEYLKGIIALRKDGKVVEPGWATDRDYEDKVWSIVKEYNLLCREEESEVELLQIYDNGRKMEFHTLKATPGMTHDGNKKLMVRVEPTTFIQRLKYLFS